MRTTSPKHTHTLPTCHLLDSDGSLLFLGCAEGAPHTPCCKVPEAPEEEARRGETERSS